MATKKVSKSKASEAARLKVADSQLLSREDIFKGGDIPFTPVEIPELDKDGRPGVVYLKQPAAGDVLDFAGLEDGDERNDGILDMVRKVTVDSNGKQIFNANDEMEKLPLGVFTRISNAVLKLVSDSSDDTAGNE